MEFYACKVPVFGEFGIVAVVAQVIESFGWVLNGDLEDGRVGYEGRDHGVVEMFSMRMFLVGREDEELGDAGAAGKRGDRYWCEVETRSGMRGL